MLALMLLTINIHNVLNQHSDAQSLTVELDASQAPNTSVHTWMGSRLSWTKASMRAGIWLWMMKLHVASRLGMMAPSPAHS